MAKEDEKRIRFKDLSTPLKIVVVYGWMVIALTMIYFYLFVVAMALILGD